MTVSDFKVTLIHLIKLMIKLFKARAEFCHVNFTFAVHIYP